MVNKIADELIFLYGGTYRDTKVNANKILDVIEGLGMLPPGRAILNFLEDKSILPPGYEISTNYSTSEIKYINEWEPENE